MPDLARVGLGNGTEPREMIETKGGVATPSRVSEASRPVVNGKTETRVAAS